jgi:outer membrane protein TolC
MTLVAWCCAVPCSIAADQINVGLPSATTLHVAAELAWKRHPEAAALDAREAAIGAAQEIASGLTPDAGAVSLSSRNDSLNRHPGLQEHELEITTALWLPGQKSARQLEALARLEELQARRIVIRWEIAGQVREAWWQITMARNAKMLAEHKFEAANSLADDVQRRYRVGDVSRVDANLAQSEAHTTQAELLDAGAALAQAEQAFQLLTGAQIINAAMLDEELAHLDTHLTIINAQKIVELSTAHPLSLQADRVLKSARARAKLAEQSQRAAPELALRVVRERGGLNEAFVNSIGVRLKIPFSSSAQVRQDDTIARADTIQTEFDLIRVRALVQSQIEQSLQTQQLVTQQIDLAQKSLTLANDNLQLAEKAYRLGESDLVSLLRARSAAFQAVSFFTKQSLARAVAISRTNQALGFIP